MLNKLYETIIKIIKENYKFLISLIVVFLILTFPLPYYIEAPGGLIDVSKRIDISNSYEINGSFNLAYVKELKATIPTLIYSLFDDDWDVLKKNEVISSNETESTSDYRSHLLLEEANSNAIYVGFNLAQEYVSVINQKVYLVYIDVDSNTNLSIGDEIIKVNGNNINCKKDINDILSNYSDGDKILFTVINNGTEAIKEGTIKNYDGKNIIGIVVSEIKDIDTNREINFNFKSSESGPSGGFMMALSIYNYLIDDDISHGLKIVGTGTIDENGNVGEIGGIEYKLKGSIKENADIFFVPQDNYDEALNIVKENKLDINLVKVNNIKDAIDYLNNL